MDGIYEVLIKTFAGCSREQMHLWVLLAGVAMAVLIGWLLYLVYKKGQKLQAARGFIINIPFAVSIHGPGKNFLSPMLKHAVFQDGFLHLIGKG